VKVSAATRPAASRSVPPRTPRPRPARRPDRASPVKSGTRPTNSVRRSLAAAAASTRNFTQDDSRPGCGVGRPVGQRGQRGHRFGRAPCRHVCPRMAGGPRADLDGRVMLRGPTAAPAWATGVWGGGRLSTGSLSAPLTGQLSNRQFAQNLAWFVVPAEPPDQSDRGQPSLCTCGCGVAVAPPRKFVNQKHYSAWLSQVRHLGRNRRPRPR
jgi:hypothetical protein